MSHVPVKVTTIPATGYGLPGILVSDPDPVDAARVDNSVKMLRMAQTLLSGSQHDMSSGELRYMAKSLCQSLDDVLDVMGVDRD